MARETLNDLARLFYLNCDWNEILLENLNRVRFIHLELSPYFMET